jgi:hypothetical protein
MKKIVTILAIVSFTLVSSSCKNEKTLQGYLVESQNKAGFIKFDIPTSFLQLKNEDASEDIKATLKSIRKINIIALPVNSNNKEAYETEKNLLKAILKDESYRVLMSMKNKGIHVNLYYTGNADAIDEIIAFGYNEEIGVGVARLLGDKMNPAAITQLMENLKLDGDQLNLEQFSALFEGK